MDYSELVGALNNGDDARTNEILKDLIPRLMRYLEIELGASESDAEDSVQEGIESVVKVIREGGLNNDESVYSFLMTTCRNCYLQILRKRREVNYDQVPSFEHHLPDQLEAIIDKERKRILERCLEELDHFWQRFMHYWFNNPDYHAEAVAKKFNMTVNNVWTRKHRIINQLAKCFQKKSKK